MSGRPLVQVVIASTRPGRAGFPVGQWAAQRLREDGAFDVEIVDLAEVNLPMLQEPRPAVSGQYAMPTTRAFSETVARADGFLFVFPEYNHSYNAALKNAIDHLFHEWSHKPVGLISYGGVAGGVRAAQALKPVLAAIQMLVVPEGVLVPLVGSFVTGEGTDRMFIPNGDIERGMEKMLNSLKAWMPLSEGLRSRLVS